jgi:hypothetical protein
MIIRECALRPRFQHGKMALLPLALAFVLAACGGSGDDPTPQPQPQPTPLPSPPPTVPPLATGTPTKLTFGGTIGTKSNWPDGDTSTGGQGADVDGLPCQTTMPDTYHVHAHLSIFLNGEQLIVPQRLGIPRDGSGGDKCFYSLHTHDQTGELHVEAGAPATFTLGQLFDIWGQPLDTTNVNVGGIVGLPIAIFVVEDGGTAATLYTDDPKKLELKGHRQVTIQIGSSITALPVYDFNGA